MTEEIRTDNTDVIANACKKITELEKHNEELKKQLDLKEKALSKAKKETKRIADRVNKDKRRLIRRKAELEAQIEKMKCCENCDWYYLQQHWRESKEINEGYCRNRDRLIAIGFPNFKDCKEYAEHLTKAKEIIKKLMVFAEMDDREYEKEYKEAEQFLSEVEK